MILFAVKTSEVINNIFEYIEEGEKLIIHFQSFYSVLIEDYSIEKVI